MRWLLFVISVLVCQGIAAQKAAYDSTPVTPRSFSQPSIDVYKQDPQFQYEKLKEPALSLWQRFWIWVWDLVDRIMSNPGGRATVNTILILLAIAAIIFFVLKLVGDRSQLFGGKGSRGLPYTVGTEDIHAISFDEAIQQALAAENYRLAVRLVYLHSLKLLSDRSLIDWKPGKTNTAYLQELQQHSTYDAFQRLTSEFELAWYGGEEVSREHYQDIEHAFDEFKTSIGQ